MSPSSRRAVRLSVVGLTLTGLLFSGTANGATKKPAAKKATTTTKKPAATTTAAPSATTPAPAATAAPSSKKGDTLTVALGAVPNSLDPGKAANQPFQQYPISMAYEPLIRLTGDLKYTPGLAQSWSLDGLNETFTIKLRPGLKFADGTPLDATAAANSMNYFMKNSNTAVSQGASVNTITAKDPLTIVVTQKTSNPEIPRFFSTNMMAGSIISPAGLAEPAKMANASFGAGPYIYDASNSVPGSTYTYTPNKNFYDPKLQYWNKVVFRVIPDLTARVQAVQTGQVDVASVDGTVYTAAKNAGVEVSLGAPAAVFGVVLADRGGTMVKALADVDVRRALNYAIDRPAICKAALGEAGGEATVNFPTLDYDESLDKLYGYNEAKAKQLLADAGYPNGFKMQLEATAIAPFGIIGQAVASYWRKIGIDIDYISTPTLAASQTGQRARQFPAYVYGYGILPSVNVSTSFVKTLSNAFNPFALSDPQILDLVNQAPAFPPAEAAKMHKKAFARATDLAFDVNMCLFNSVVIGNKKVTGWQVPKVGIGPYPNMYMPN